MSALARVIGERGNRVLVRTKIETYFICTYDEKTNEVTASLLMPTTHSPIRTTEKMRRKVKGEAMRVAKGYFLANKH